MTKDTDVLALKDTTEIDVNLVREGCKLTVTAFFSRNFFFLNLIFHLLIILHLIDIKECVKGSHNYSPVAQCVDVPGSFRCICIYGFTGNGIESTGRSPWLLLPQMMQPSKTCIATVHRKICFYILTLLV